MTDEPKEEELELQPESADDTPEGDLGALPPRHQGYALLRSLGIPQTAAGSMVGYNSKGSASYLEKRIPKKYNLTNPTFLKLAANRIKAILKMEPVETTEPLTVKGNPVLGDDGKPIEVTKKIFPRHSDALEAAKTVMDRVQPKPKAEDGPNEVHQTFIQINLGNEK